ncbi:MAG: hypothetical protein RQ753_09135, partial [Desulfurivibrionaceae bacterium]|nr:hypothetical protein [Desulfurivibrionaceae bacterium]
TVLPRWQRYRTAGRGGTKATEFDQPSDRGAAAPPVIIQRLAVMDLEGIGVGDEVAYALSDYLRDEIHVQAGYEVLSREDLEALARRTSLQQQAGSCVDTGCLVDFGKALGTKYMVAGSISKLGNTYSVSLRLLDTEGDQAGVKNRINERCRCSEDQLFDVIEKMAGKIVN